MAGAFDSIMKPLTAAQPVSDAGVLQSIAAVKKAPGATSSQIGAALAESEGQKQIQQMQSQAQKAATLGEQELAGQQLSAQRAESARSIALQKLADKNDERLASLQSDAANTIAKQSREFKTDEMNRKYMNQQMLDQYAAEQLLSSESLNNYVQQKEQMMTRKMQLMDSYSKKLQQILEQGYLKEKGDLDQVSKEKITKIAAAFQQKKADEMKKLQRSSSNKGLIVGAFTAIGTVVGAVYGGGPAGASVGSAAGAAIGGMVGGVLGGAAAESTVK